MIRVLITGVSGFTGRYMAAEARRQGAQVYGLSRQSLSQEDFHIFSGDLMQPESIGEVLRNCEPDYIVHLAAQTPANTPGSALLDWITTNPISTLNLLEAVRIYRPQARVLIISSSAVYGHVPEANLPIIEHAPLQPTTMYGVSKATQELIAIRYAAEYHLQIIRARPFNQIGPGEPAGMLTSILAAQVAAISNTHTSPIIRLRHRATQRDFTDIRDTVRAYWALLQSGTPGEVYNVCSGVATPIGDLLEHMLQIAGVSAQVEETSVPGPDDIVIQAGDNTKLRQQTGWQPEITLTSSLTELIRTFGNKQ